MTEFTSLIKAKVDSYIRKISLLNFYTLKMKNKKKVQKRLICLILLGGWIHFCYFNFIQY